MTLVRGVEDADGEGRPREDEDAAAGERIPLCSAADDDFFFLLLLAPLPWIDEVDEFAAGVDDEVDAAAVMPP